MALARGKCTICREMATKNDLEMEGDLENRLKAHSDYFTSMVELIPAKFYVIKDDLPDEEGGGGETVSDSKFWVNKRARAPKQPVKEATKKAKRLKLDPASHNKNSERNHEEGVGESDVGGARGGASGSSLEKQGDIYGSNGAGEGEDSITKRRSEAGTAVSLNGFSVERVQSGDLSDLRERLHSKIAALRGKRKLMSNEGAPDEGEDDDISSKGASEKRRKVMEKRQHKKELRRKGKEHKQSTKREKRSAGDNSKRPSIKDESGRIVFSKFDFSTPAEQSEPKPRSKDYKKLLAKAEVAQKRLEKLKEVDEKKSEELQEKLQWQRAMEMAKGTKIRDDTKRLKKTVKRLDSKKAKSHKQWLERQKQETLAKEKRQEKRKKNIQERIDQAKAKKLKKRGGGKSRRPGF